MFLSNESDDSSCDCRRAVGVGVAGDNFDNFVPHNVKMMTKVQLDKVERVIKGKAALGLKKFNDFKQKVKAEEMDMKINDSNDMKVSKEVQGGWILTKDQMEYLKSKPYEYNASAGSILELLFLQRFWTWLSKFIPNSISPCVITCTGLAINIITTLTVLYYSPDARSEAPWWTFLLCAIGVFIYQTLDALDGKQCYKVQNTHIEEVYDHGCDAVSTIFVTLAVSCAGQLGRIPALQFSLFMTSMLAFYSTHWQCHVTRQMVFGKIDVSEGQWVMIIIHLLTAWYGQRIWQNNISIFGVEFALTHVLALATVISMSTATLANIRLILGQSTPLDRYVKIERKTHNIWSPLFPCLILTILALISFSSGYFHVSPSLFVMAFGFAFAKITIKLVMMNCCHGDMELWDSSLIAPFLLALNLLASYYVLHPKTALLCALCYSVMDFAHYFTYASWDLRVALDVDIFSIKYPPGDPRNRRQCLGYYTNGINNDTVLKVKQQDSIKREEKLSSIGIF